MARGFNCPRQAKHAAFDIHQAIEQAYTCVLLTLTNYAPPSHNLKFLRSLAKEQDRRLADAFPRDQHQERAWFNSLNEAYVKARYSKHYEISEEALTWLAERASIDVFAVLPLPWSALAVKAGHLKETR